MEKILESDEIDKGFVGLEEKIRDIKKIKD